MAQWIFMQAKSNRKVGKSKNERVKHSHNSWSTASCSSSWHSKGAYSRLCLSLWHCSSRSTRETPFILQGPEESKKTYLSRYGERWVDNLKSSTAMSKFCCITEPILFMMNETYNLMKGSVNENYLFIVHNVLVFFQQSKQSTGWYITGTYIYGCPPSMHCRMRLLMPNVL